MKRKKRMMRGELEMMPRETLRESSPGSVAVLTTWGRGGRTWRLEVLGDWQLWNESYFHRLSHGIEMDFENLRVALTCYVASLKPDFLICNGDNNGVYLIGLL